jgi:hypothetical protein
MRKKPWSTSENSSGKTEENLKRKPGIAIASSLFKILT